MSRTIKIYCVNTSEYVDVEGGATLAEIAATLSDRLPAPPVCARVNNKTEPLDFAVYQPKMVEFQDATAGSGPRVCVRSLCMMLYRAVCALMPGAKLRIEHSIAKGYFCKLDRPCNEADALALKAEMKRLADADIPFERKQMLTADVIEIFRSQGLDDKVKLLTTTHPLYTTFYTIDGIADSYYGALVPSTGYLKVFDLLPYHDGLLLLGPDADNHAVPATPIVQEKMFGAFTAYLDFNRIIGVHDVGQLNEQVERRRAADIINVAEALHEKSIARISEDIATRYAEGGARIVLIAGPSSSGKTTTTKRLAIQLMTNLLKPQLISLDDYFVDRVRTPRDADGDYDYESLYALDLEQFNADLNAILAGKEVELPSYSFELGKRQYKGNRIRLEEGSVLLIEGIHGLNPALTPGIPREQKFCIYVSCLTSVAMDNMNRIATTDNRLLRRLTRDYYTRGHDAAATLQRWPSVRRGEERHIFPYQENADVMFNSSLFYEISVLRSKVEPILREVPDTLPEYGEAKRLLKFLDNFIPIASDEIPPTSILREFIGGSSFKY